MMYNKITQTHKSKKIHTYVPSSLLRQKTRKGSDFPKKSFLSSLLAQSCMVAMSWKTAWHLMFIVHPQIWKFIFNPHHTYVVTCLTFVTSKGGADKKGYSSQITKCFPPKSSIILHLTHICSQQTEAVSIFKFTIHFVIKASNASKQRYLMKCVGLLLILNLTFTLSVN